MSHRLNTIALITTLCSVVCTSRATADWFYDFDDQQVPESWVLSIPPIFPPSETWSWDASSGYLNISESRSFNQGGTPVLVVLDESETFSDVRVSGTINLDSSVGTFMALIVRSSETIGDYSFGIELASTADRGTAWLARATPQTGLLGLGSQSDFGIPTRLDIDSSYYLEFDIIGDQLTGRFLDSAGGNELISISWTDPNPLAQPFYAGVYTDSPIGIDDIPTGGTFDDISAVSLTKPLLAGDADQDLDFDQQDVIQVQVAAKYLTGQAATWGEGDWDGAPGGSPGNPPAGDGEFNQFDIIAAQLGAVYLTGPYAAVQANGQRGDGQTSVIYDAGTGELAIDAPAGADLTSINIDSAAGVFTGSAAQNLGGSFDNDADANVFKATFGSSFGSLSFGTVAQAGLSEESLLGDLTVIGSLAGGGDLGDVDLVYVPEPTSVLLLTIGLAMGRLHMSRASRQSSRSHRETSQSNTAM